MFRFLVLLVIALLAAAVAIWLGSGNADDLPIPSAKRPRLISPPAYSSAGQATQGGPSGAAKSRRGEDRVGALEDPPAQNPALQRPGPPDPPAQEQARQSAETAADAAARLAATNSTVSN